MTGESTSEQEPIWGEGAEMSAFETLSWRAEADPRLRSTITAILMLDREPGWERFLAAHEYGTRRVARLRQRVVAPVVPTGNAVWAPDNAFDLTYHVRHMRLPEPGTREQLLALAATLASTPFDRTRAQWEATLIGGLEEGGAAYVLKLHHSMTDGIGTVQLLSQLLNTSRDPRLPSEPSTLDLGNDVTPWELTGRQALSALLGAPGQIGRTGARAITAMARGLAEPVATVDSAVRSAESAIKLAKAGPGAPSELLKGRSRAWRYASHEFGLTELRAAAKSAGGTVNDAFIAGLLGAFRIYHERLGAEVGSLPVAFPISLRKENDPMGGNKIGSARLKGPMAVADAGQRIQRIRKQVMEARSAPGVDAAEKVAPLLNLLPTGVLTAALGSYTKGHDLQASNVPGLTREAYLSGAKVTSMYGFGPVPGCAAMATMLTHNGICCIAVTLDPAAVTAPDLFVECLREGFSEVLALASGDAGDGAPQ